MVLCFVLQVKLRRLLRYLELKDLKTAALKGSGLDEEEASDVGMSQGWASDCSRATIAQLVGTCIATVIMNDVNDAALWVQPSSELYTSGYFPLGVNLSSHSTPYSFALEYTPQSSLYICIPSHGFKRTSSHIVDKWMSATKTHPACTICINKMWQSVWLN